MKTLRMTRALAGQDAAPAVEAMLRQMEGPGVLAFEPGEYPLQSPIRLENLRGLTLEGNGCTFVPRYDRESEAENSAEVFHVSGCQEITLRNFTICASQPANAAGVVLRVTPAYVDVRMNGPVPLSGREQFISGMTFGADGAPTYHWWVKTDSDPARRTLIAGEIPCTAPRQLNTPHEALGGQDFRVYSRCIQGLEPGMHCNISHSYYGLVACVFRSCREVTVERVRITNYGGFGFAILPRCQDFTFRGLQVASADPTRQPYALTSDGIHVTGLTGHLLLEDCAFDCIGDDCLNVHTQVMTVREAKDGIVRLVYDKPGGVVSPVWAAPGDGLRVYDPHTLALKGVAEVDSWAAGRAVLRRSKVSFAPGDLVTNDAYYPAVTLRRCTARNYRGRAFVLQAVSRALVEECDFSGVSGPGVYCSTAFDHWLEAGPVSHVTLRNNRFRGNGVWANPQSAAVFVRVVGEQYQEVAPLHRDLVLEENQFEDVVGRPISVALTDRVRIEKNRFIRCGFPEEPILLCRCTGVICRENRVGVAENDQEAASCRTARQL